MKRRNFITAEVEVDVSCVLEQLDSDEIAELAREEGFEVLATGVGDRAHREHLVERAFLAAKRLQDLPREIADLFWHVHGRAV